MARRSVGPSQPGFNRIVKARVACDPFPKTRESQPHGPQIRRFARCWLRGRPSGRNFVSFFPKGVRVVDFLAVSRHENSHPRRPQKARIS
tara:strand:- start:362 stop:631 length:270 start_codon:yes stop_codon:yes gene_type:complete